MGILNLNCFGGSSSSSTSFTKQPTAATVEYLCHRFSLSQLRKSTNDFNHSRIICRTAYCFVYRACIPINGELKHVALKRLRQDILSYPEKLSAYKNNVIYRCQLHHPNLVSLVGFCHDANEFIVASDYAPNGSLHDQLDRTESKSSSPALLSWKKKLEIIIGAARGLHYLHSGTKRTIIHRDITLRAILLDENWVPKLNISMLSMKGPFGNHSRY